MQILNRAAIRRSNTGNIPVVDYWCLRVMKIPRKVMKMRPNKKKWLEHVMPTPRTCFYVMPRRVLVYNAWSGYTITERELREREYCWMLHGNIGTCGEITLYIYVIADQCTGMWYAPNSKATLNCSLHNSF